MSAFADYLKLRKRHDGRWIVDAEFRYWSDRFQRFVVVPEGFDTDLASVPRIPLIYLATGGTADEPAVVHDYLYRTQRTTRKVADQVFREACAVANPPEPLWRRWVMYLGLRAFGWRSWREDRENGLFVDPS